MVCVTAGKKHLSGVCVGVLVGSFVVVGVGVLVGRKQLDFVGV